MKDANTGNEVGSLGCKQRQESFTQRWQLKLHGWKESLRDQEENGDKNRIWARPTFKNKSRRK